MATIMLMMIVGLFAFTIIPWIGNEKLNKLHYTDLMAGDEGEDQSNTTKEEQRLTGIYLASLYVLSSL